MGSSSEQQQLMFTEAPLTARPHPYYVLSRPGWDSHWESLGAQGHERTGKDWPCSSGFSTGLPPASVGDVRP